MTPLTLHLWPQAFAVCRLPPEAPLPTWAQAAPFFSLTRTPMELSLVCLQEGVPAEVRHEPGWRCLQVAGPLAFELVGVLASLSVPLAQAGISLFVLSTFDTDYLFVKATHLQRAKDVLRQAGHEVRP